MTDLRETIGQVTTRILEDWGMMMVETVDLDRGTFATDGDFFSASVLFRGEIEGKYSILCQRGFMECLAANLLGSLEGTSEDEQDDALREMANVLCGNLLTECYGEDMVFELDLLGVESLVKDQLDRFFTERTVCYLADDEPVAVTFQLEMGEG